MFEKNLVINNREIEHHGIFRVDDIFNAINQALKERGYQKREKKSEEQVFPEGRYIYLELRPYKEINDYITAMIKIRITLQNVTETAVKKNDLRQRFETGDVHIAFDAWSLTNFGIRWTMRPVIYFIRGVIHKYIYKYPLEIKRTQEVAADTAYIYAEVKRLMRSYEAKPAVSMKEEEVRKKVEEEIQKGSI